MKLLNHNFVTHKPRLLANSLALAVALCGPVANAQDALEQSALPSPLAPHALLLDLDRVGQRLVAVGERGHILISADEAQSWQQVPVPVRVTLTSSYFVDEKYGWAVGHDGVILRTQDGGSSWRKVLDGNQAHQITAAHAQQLLTKAEQALTDAPEEQIEDLELALENISILSEDAESFLEEGASRPFLDVWFKNRQEGFAVGAFGLIMHTRDGGDSWEACFDRLENPDNFHLNAIQQVGDRLFMTAEAGTLFRSEDSGQSWELLNSPYDGSFFGVVGDDSGRLVAYGLRGNAFQSNDWGDNWESLDTGVDSGLYGGALLEDGSVVLVGDAGVSVFFDGQGQRIGKHQTEQRLPLSTVIASKDKNLLTAGLTGVQPSPFVGGSN